jgi:hypothetical protein
VVGSTIFGRFGDSKRTIGLGESEDVKMWKLFVYVVIISGGFNCAIFGGVKTCSEWRGIAN